MDDELFAKPASSTYLAEAIQLLKSLPPNKVLKQALFKLQQAQERPVDSLVNEYELNSRVT